ncbi:MAG: hypothetical protein IPJ18_20190 [Betaproteobacteria bacterium]|nr:hypothetical protein [Betaproteobacteria bacterium]
MNNATSVTERYQFAINDAPKEHRKGFTAVLEALMNLRNPRLSFTNFSPLEASIFLHKEVPHLFKCRTIREELLRDGNPIPPLMLEAIAHVDTDPSALYPATEIKNHFERQGHVNDLELRYRNNGAFTQTC